MTPKIDLNCDLGEGAGHDQELMPLISSVNIACGWHAGDLETMRQTVWMAKNHWVAVGAHPGFEDRENFGRKEISLPPEEIFALVTRQIALLKKVADEFDMPLTHVKPHGALYNMAARDAKTARAVAEAVHASGKFLVLYALSGSELVKAGLNAGLHVAQEVFADRMYQIDGSLVPRSQPGALHTAEDAMISQVLNIIEHGIVRVREGIDIAIHADTVCLHGDGPHALSFAKALREELKDAGIEVKRFSA